MGLFKNCIIVLYKFILGPNLVILHYFIFVEIISKLIFNVLLQICDLTNEIELANRRSDRLDQQLADINESRIQSKIRERSFISEIKQMEQKCADIEIKVI